MSNVIAIIEKDHRTVEGMFSSYNTNQDESVLSQLLDELTLHDTIEQEVIYPALREQGVAVDAAIEAHGTVAELIAQIREALATDDENLAAMVQALEGDVAVHVDDEEQNMLQHLADIEDDEAAEMISRIEALKQG